MTVIEKARNLRWEAWRKLIEIGPTNENLEEIIRYRHGKMKYEATKRLLSQRPSNRQLGTIMLYGNSRKLTLESMEVLISNNPDMEDIKSIYHHYQMIIPVSKRKRRLKHEAWDKFKDTPEGQLKSLRRIKLF